MEKLPGNTLSTEKDEEDWGETIRTNVMQDHSNTGDVLTD